ncbi:MAG: hypothetical protein JW958_09830 [Candidatus Eisenbacteria bacterium]|nr:hypothetical protein [Candidatus Eisenbacteria bacterium]
MNARHILVALFLAAAFPAAAHEVLHEETTGDATIVRFHYADGTPFSYESYEVYRAGERIPYQTGFTDAEGRVVFLPDREGEWRVRVFSEDGHGGEMTLTAGGGEAPRAGRPAVDRYARLLAGLGFLFGLFGLISLFYRGRSARRG